MIAVESKQNEVVSDVQQKQTKQVFFAQMMGVSFDPDNTIAKNAELINIMKAVPEGDIVKEQNLTSFSIHHAEMGYLLHKIYCNTPEGMKLNVEYDGIWPFEAKDEDGSTRVFNAQLITISEQPVQ
jgi:hypothetical protein